VDERALAGASAVTAAASLRPLILVTRPRGPGQELAAALRAAGSDALWLPAFDLQPPVDPLPVEAAAGRLRDFDLAVFVSPAAVEAFAAALPPGGWPSPTAIGAMGAATRAAVLARLPGSDAAKLLCPEGTLAADGGSEALWPLVQSHRPAPRRVLIVRAQGGRPWLSEQLCAAGVQVQELPAYRRSAHVPTPWESAALHAAVAAGRRLAILYSSAEAIEVVAGQLGADAALAGAWTAQLGLCVHERIVRLLRARGAADVQLCAAEVEAVRRALD
jgi:uroporphyrinogen-III synthase